MMPLVKQLCEKAQTRDDTTGGVITKYFGKLVNGLLSVMTNEDIVWFLQCYKKLANRGFSIKPGEAKGDPSLVSKLLTFWFYLNLDCISSFSGHGM